MSEFEKSIKSLDIHVDGEKIEITYALSKEVARTFIASMYCLVKDAPNYIEMSFHVDKAITDKPEHLLLTIQKQQGITPHNARKGAETKLELAEVALKYYADKFLYTEGDDCQYPEITKDEGKLARETLKKLGELK